MPTSKKASTAKILTIICFLLYFSLGLAFVFLGRIHTDEQIYLYSAFALTKGQILYEDFFYQHGPIMPYVYSIPQLIFGQSLITGRLTSLFFGILMLFMVYKISKKLGGEVSALISVALISFSLVSVYNFTAMMTYTLSIFLALSSIYLLLTKLKEPIKIFASVFLMALAVETRIVIFPGLILLLIYVLVKHLKNIKNLLAALVSLILNFLIVIFPFLLIAKKQLIFDTLIWAFSQNKFFEEFGILVKNRFFGINFGVFYLDFILDTTRDFFIPIVVALAAIIFFVVKVKNKEIRIKKFMQKNPILLLVFGTFVLVEAGYIYAVYLPPHYTNYIYPLMCIFSGVVISRFLSKIEDATILKTLKMLLFILILLSPLIQERPAINFSQNTTYRISDVYQAKLVSEKIKQYTAEEDKIFTFTPLYAAAADRMVMPGMERFYYSFFPTWSTEKAKEYNVANADMLLDYLSSKKAGAVVLTDWFFGNQTARARAIIDKYRPAMQEAIEKNYYLKEKIEGIRFEGDVYIYLPRQP